jgi:hypothetical protein
MAQLASFLDAFWAAPLQRLQAVAEASTRAEDQYDGRRTS